MTHHQPTTPPRQVHGQVGGFVRGVAALVVLVAGAVGVPALLLRIGPDLVDRVPPVGQIPELLTRPDDGSLLILVVLAAAWVGWAMFTASVLLEVVARVRDLPAPDLPGLRPTQRAAAVLIGAVVLTLGAAPQPAAPPLTAHAAPPVAEAPLSTTSVGQPGGPPVAPAGLPEAAAANPPSIAPQTSPPDGAPSVVVQRGDTLWSLAERHLGSGPRYAEIVTLNLGCAQPDGRSLTDAAAIYPGWQLALPSDARHTQNPPQAAPAATPQVVEPGDTLWEIAAERLGDGTRYPEVFQANHGRPQPDGRRLEDPDLLHPGWHLAIPTEHMDAVLSTRTERADPQEEKAQPSAHDHVGSGAPAAAVPPRPGEPDGVAPEPAPVKERTVLGSAADPVEDPAAGEEEPESPAVPALVLGLGAVAATGFVAELARRRGLQQRFRRPGRRIAATDHPEERALRARSDELTVHTARDAFRQLAHDCQDQRRPLPDVQTVRLGPTGMLLGLAEDAPDPVGPFTATDPRTWRLDPAATLDEADMVADPYPALVCVGVAEETMVLVNVESAGRLTVTGADTDVAAVIAALAFELAVSPFGETMTLSLVDCLPGLVGETGQARTRSLGSAQADTQATTRRRQVDELLRSRGVPDLSAARTSSAANDEATCEVFVTTTTALQRCPDPWSGLAEITSGTQGVDAGTAATSMLTLDLHDGGRARLHPLGIEIHPQRLSDDVLGRLGETLAVASDVDEQPADDEPKPEAVAAALPTLPRPATVGELSTDVPRVLLLGPVEVTGTDDSKVPGRRGKATELVAFLALHPGASMYEVDEALWPERRVPRNTRNGLTSRARAWLGRDDDGALYLPLVGGGGEYQLDPRVTCDWHDFLALAERGLAAETDGIDDLERALALVRGRPFLGIRPDTYTWAEKHVQEMISAIVDVADVVARHHAQAGEHRRAANAALAGLRADAASENLAEIAVAAFVELGDHEAAARVQETLRRMDG